MNRFNNLKIIKLTHSHNFIDDVNAPNSCHMQLQIFIEQFFI